MMIYVGATLDLFISTKAIAIKSIVSKIIPENELGKVLSVLGLIDLIDAFIFPTLYSFVYRHTVETFLGAIYFLSEFFFVLTLLMFVIIYIFLKGMNTKRTDDEELAEKYKSNPNMYEVTKL